ncbi:hypothetical protein E2R68_05190 [Psychromonas sp. RZ22]|uniref:polysaccharide lyase family 7 protein n=1 Tax=Psychromonas algarum TaxID=2555643 RepID=UPI0010687F76|nr:polysaccharide lyase family 7 protein [Psychromonas sp. RZ22]TEW55771.1 hypothetical protein E2R68_05190 [Psychromonas sp. RZ22]
MKWYIFIFLSLLLTGCAGSKDDSSSVAPDNDETPDFVPEEDKDDTPDFVPEEDKDEIPDFVPEEDKDDTEPNLPIIPDSCVVSAIASSSDGDNVASNVLDNNTSTRWSGDGLGATLRLDLCEYTTINGVNVALYNGDSRSSTFTVEVSNDAATWTNALAKTTSSGNSVEIESYDFDKITARYVRYTGYGNSDNTWNSVTVFSVVECTGNDCEPEYPTEPDKPVIPDNDCEVSGQISFNGTCAEWLEVYEVEHGELNEDDHLISYSPIEMSFDALAAKHVTPNGNGWRHELKIKSSGGYRVAMTEVYELFKAKITANLSNGSKTIVAQHHADTTATITKLYIADLDEGGFANAPDGTESDSKAMNGIFDVYIRLAKPDGSGETKHLLTTIKSGESFYFEEENDHGLVTVKINGQALAPIMVNDSSASYFKFGNYHQAQNPETGDKLASGNADGDYEEFYEQYFETSEITFTEMSYIRNVD